MIPWVAALVFGGGAASLLLLGALAGYYIPFPQRVTAAIMAFGSGVLICALSFELMEKAYQQGGFAAASLGFLGGAVIYTAANGLLARHGAKNRKRVYARVTDGNEQNAVAIAIGALLDGIPESVVIGLGLLSGGGISMVTVLAVAISNIPEGLSSAAGLRQAGRSKQYIFGIWAGIVALSALAALCGYLFFQRVSPAGLSFTTTIAAGAILAMIVDTMIPEAYTADHNAAGLFTVLGFLAAFALNHLF